MEESLTYLEDRFRGLNDFRSIANRRHPWRKQRTSGEPIVSFYFRPEPTLQTLNCRIHHGIRHGFIPQLVDFIQTLESHEIIFNAIHAIEEAIVRYHQSLTTQDLFLLYKELGNLYLKTNDVEAAEDYYHKAFALRPTSATLLVNLGTLNIQKGEWLLVGHYFKEALRYQPKYDKAWVGLAMYHHYLGEFGLALANIKQALDINAGNKTALLLLHHWSNKDPHRSSHELLHYTARYLTHHPFDEEISLLLIHSAVECQNFDLAKLESEKLICLNPLNETYAQIYLELHEVAHGYNSAA